MGVLYLLQFAMEVFVRAPIKAIGPEGALAQAAAGEPMASFVVDTWTILGLEDLALGTVVLFASSMPAKAMYLAWAMIGVEMTRGIVADIYMVARGHSVIVSAVWIVIHSAVIVTGLIALRSSRMENAG